MGSLAVGERRESSNGEGGHTKGVRVVSEAGIAEGPGTGTLFYDRKESFQCMKGQNEPQTIDPRPWSGLLPGFLK